MTRRQFGAKGWSPDRLPDLTGKTYIITGGNSGIGFEAARMLGDKGGNVTILCRNEEKAKAAVKALKEKAPGGIFKYILIDLSALGSVRVAAETVRAKHRSIDGLINNAGIMMLPKKEHTTDGNEMQFGVNHLGHFALNALLCDLVEEAGGRFVSVASIAHKYAKRFRFHDANFENGYSSTGAYAHSKLANLSYALELNRRLENANLDSRAFVCHPGYSDTNLQSTGPGSFASLAMKPLTAILSQPAAKGAIPTVLCAAGEEADPGAYYGPTGFQDMTGAVDRAWTSRAARDEDAARLLWEMSEKLTGVTWPIFENASTFEKSGT